MSFPRLLLLLVSCGSLLNSGMQAQATPEPLVNSDFVQKQFGSNCKPIGMPAIKADLDGDGVEDIVIPARCTNPMMDQAEENYLVVDPYNTFFGYGNPQVTTQFASDDPDRRGFSLLVIHGAGLDAWHSTVPKAKFMIVNLPFKDVYVKKLVVKKKDRMAIYVEETGAGAMTSVLVWDGKKYRYQPMGSTLE
ncbi:MAG: hypothetical protein WB952_10105 [Terriglobales bacterium]